MSAEIDKQLANPGDFTPCRVPLHGIERPAAGQIHLWFMDLGELAGSLRSALGGGEQAEGDAHFSGGQLTFTRRFFLRLLLGAYLGIPGKSIRIVRNRRGKPVLDPKVHPDLLHFSIAKSGAGFLVGLSSNAYLGVDIESAGRRARNALGIARRYFSETEASALAALGADERDAAFLRTWSCKEAVVKSLGLGIANQLCRFSVETDMAKPAAVLAFEEDDPAAWWLQLVRPAEHFVGAIATRSEVSDLAAFRLLRAAREGGSIA
ncbi:MAG: 4'-phosphopantetheinyl transferase superfamily protein [Xanthomonadales bacterium]|nr:4'-phosphopantetheinyl transferase superfamily protein [Gammaproteobacteria bacterium]MBT8051449.1 4'-phosphopantetheinyl transferase superfamily protein [Gammaproteobacteria bacterium]MBT8056962.1 4'-phosphopantetheinyl transferase superfamily protein [Gammaproteobacteria bacterium]NNJ79224.1 4'-phosphopantetheinyl transferase superfamily protein [Xanthomonadales bacterium]NNL03734.1 4'-phosphopantetheinyl transferase superfamily protein [Xanthomonadales bacterium]